MGNYTIFRGFENPRRGRQARNLTTNVPKILDLKLSSEQIFSKNCRWVPLGCYKGQGKNWSLAADRCAASNGLRNHCRMHFGYQQVLIAHVLFELL